MEDTLWKTVLGEIETEVSRANFLTLFKKTKLISLDEDTATIAAPSTMIIDLLKKRFQEIIKKTLEKHTKKPTNIIFVPGSFYNETEKPLVNTPLFKYAEEKKPIGHLPRVRKDFTFENFAVSSSNQLAYVSAKAVSEKLGVAYNPLFIYGPVGVGKTHLMQAVANEVFTKDPDKKILYTTSEEFTNEVVEAIRENDTSRMKRKFRNLDVLIIDDIQFVAGKERVQEELFHTFNILIDKKSQIVLSSDRPPSEIKKLEKRLSSRFAGGLTVDVDNPDFELRCAILLIKAQRLGIELSMEAAKKIAEKTQDTRSLEGSLLRVITEGNARQESLTEDFVSSIIGRGEEEPRPVHADDLIKIICEYYNTKPTLLKGPKREASIVRARQITMFILKKDLGLSFAEIGNLLGGRDHTTIMHGVLKIEALLDGSIFSDEISRVRGIVRGKLVD